jgi:hypothetical protein
LGIRQDQRLPILGVKRCHGTLQDVSGSGAIRRIDAGRHGLGCVLLVGRELLPCHLRASPAPPQPVVARVGSDPGDPGSERGAGAESRQTRERPKKCFLRDLLDVRAIRQKAADDSEDEPLVSEDKDPKGVPVTTKRPLDKRAVLWVIAAPLPTGQRGHGFILIIRQDARRCFGSSWRLVGWRNY